MLPKISINNSPTSTKFWLSRKCFKKEKYKKGGAFIFFNIYQAYYEIIMVPWEVPCVLHARYVYYIRVTALLPQLLATLLQRQDNATFSMQREDFSDLFQIHYHLNIHGTACDLTRRYPHRTSLGHLDFRLGIKTERTLANRMIAYDSQISSLRSRLYSCRSKLL